jgi:hypothetical protein
MLPLFTGTGKIEVSSTNWRLENSPSSRFRHQHRRTVNPSGTEPVQRFVGFFERKSFHFGPYWNFGREFHELGTVPAR